MNLPKKKTPAFLLRASFKTFSRTSKQVSKLLVEQCKSENMTHLDTFRQFFGYSTCLKITSIYCKFCTYSISKSYTFYSFSTTYY